jgi:hypothetical protein
MAGGQDQKNCDDTNPRPVPPGICPG